MELKDAFFLAEKVMNMVATGQDSVEKDMREYVCNKLGISGDVLVEAWYKISRKDEDDEDMKK